MEIRIGDRYQSKDAKESVVVTNVYATITPRNTQIQIPPKIEAYLAKNNIVKHRAKIVNESINPNEETIEFIQLYRGDGRRQDCGREQFERIFNPCVKMGDLSDPHMKKLVDKAFQLLVDGTYSSGGDGCGTLLFGTIDWRLAANAFGEFEVPCYSPEKQADGTNIKGMEKIKDRYYRHDFPDRVLFSDMSNENMTIGPSFIKDELSQFEDIVIIL